VSETRPERGRPLERGTMELDEAPLADVEEQVEEGLDGIEVESPPLVGIVMAAHRDMEVMRRAADELKRHDIRYETRVISAYRDPERVSDYARNARFRGLRVIIAGAALSSALPAVMAAHTDLPVIGVPLSGAHSVAGGLDAVLSMVQMPDGVPVACVALDGARNAAVLAARILGAS
jgi:phosphoribosylaminoimidazole carboxylase PurE protein